MSTHDRDHQIDNALWQAQERARHLHPDADPVELRIARALRRAPGVALPADFATQVAALARAQASPAASEQAVLEQRLLRGLILAFALSAAGVVGWLGRGWVVELGAVLPGGGDAVAWSGVAALCLLGNWGVGLLRGHHAGRMHAAG